MLWRCARCGVIYVNDRVDCGELGELYDHYYDRAQFETPTVVVAAYERLLRSCEPYRRTGRWLDVGYGEGGLLKMAETGGWNCYGSEVSPAALAYGAECGWTVSAEAENDARFPAQGFDVVSMVEFIEHVPAPERWLRAAACWLRPGGLLYVTTPNAASLNRRLLGVEWSIFCPPEHLTIWTARGLSAALIKTGFQPQRIRAEGFNPCEIIARWANWRAQRDEAVAVDRNQTALALNTALSGTRWRRAVKAGVNQCLSALQIGDGLKVWAVRREQPMKGTSE